MIIKYKLINHFETFKTCGKVYNIYKNKLNKIKELLCEMDPNIKNKRRTVLKKIIKVTSGKKGKVLQSSKGESYRVSILH